jgi:HlyD family secretion protein
MLDTRSRLQREVRIATAAIVLFGGTAFASATLIPLEGAVVTHGTVVIDGNVKKVQHQTGGIIGSLHVREGSRITQGDIIARLDDTQTRATLGVVLSDLIAQRARLARLVAERDGEAQVTFPDDVTSPDVRSAETRLFDSRRAALAGQKAQLQEKLSQARQDQDGLDKQRVATEQQLAIARAEYKNLEPLRASGLIQRPRLAQLEREIARSEGVLGDAIARLTGGRARMREIEEQIVQVDRDRAAEVTKDLRDTEAKIAELVERRIAAEDQLRRVNIRAPATGMVHELSVHTVGGVVTPGETLMFIVPDPDAVLVEVRVSPNDIDQVHIGQPTRLRFTTFNQRTTPEVAGQVIRVSPNSSRDPQTGLTFFTAGVRLLDGEAARLGPGNRLLPGMTADAYLKTTERTIMNFLIKPLTDNFDKVFAGR